MSDSPFGTWLERTRTQRGLSKAELSRMSGVDRAYVQRLEAGMVTEPGADVRGKLHAALGTSDDDLVRDGFYERREHPQADGTVRVAYVPLPLIPEAQVPSGARGDAAFYEALAEYLPLLGEAQRRHLIETARMMVTAAVRRGSTPASSPSPAREATAHDPDHSPAR